MKSSTLRPPERQANRLTGETTRPARCDGVLSMKHTATQALVTIAIALAIVVIIKAIQARAAGDNLHSEVIGTWCSETRAGPSGPDNREWYIRGGDCESFNPPGRDRRQAEGARVRVPDHQREAG